MDRKAAAKLEDTYCIMKQLYTLQWTVNYSPSVLSEFQRVVWRRTDVMTGFTHSPDRADKLSSHGAYQASIVYGVLVG